MNPKKMKASDKNNLSLIDSLVIDLIDEMPLEARVSIANLVEHEIRVLELALGKYLKYRLEQLSEVGNDELIKECTAISGKESLNEIETATVILKEVWNRLRETHKLRIIK